MTEVDEVEVIVDITFVIKLDLEVHVSADFLKLKIEITFD
jgi:HSP20 family molecular chaperone IbpA